MVPGALDGGDRLAARAIFAHVVVLVALSLVLAFLSPGWLYTACAVIGGALFVQRAWRLVREPGRTTAVGSFRASLVQLSLLLLGAIADGWLRSAIGG